MQLNQTDDNLITFIDKIKENNPNINSLLTLMVNFITILRESIENKNIKDISWDNPSIKLEYLISTDETSKEIIFLKPHSINSFIENTVERHYIDTFKSITKGIYIIKEKNSSTRNIPDSILEEFKKLPYEEQIIAIDNYLKIDPLIIRPNNNKPGLTITIYPLIIDKDTNQKFFSVLLHVDINSFKPSKWTEKTKNEFWTTIIDYILKISSDSISENTFSPEFVSLPTPKMISVNTTNKLIKTSLHTELQKFGKKPKKNQSSLFDLLDPIDEETKKDITGYQINVVGIENTQAQNQALFAIQKLLDQTGYKGNIKGKQLSTDDNSFKFNGNLPFLKFTFSDYLEAYGVTKRKTPRGKMEYNSNERAESLKALTELSQKKYIFYYARKYWKDGKELFDVIKTVRPIFNIIEGYEAIENSEINIMNTGETSESLNEKLKIIAIEPCPILVDQIDTYFVLKPANCYEEIKLLVGKTSKYVPLFIDFLRAEVAKREINSRGNDIDWLLELNYETLAHKLRMEGFIKAKQTKRIRETLDKCYTIASQLGYLLDYKTINGSNLEIERLSLNPDKFKRVKEIDEERKKVELI